MSIELKNVSYTYMPGTPMERQALMGVNMTLERGRFYAIAGHTGSGKSTLIQQISGLLTPTSGEVLEVVKRLHRERGLTVLLITHFMEEALEAQRVVVMDKGCSVMEGSPREVFARRKELKALGLEVPLAGELAAGLRQAGVPLPKEAILTVEELLQGLQALRGKAHVH